jgi:hypothetical protein
MALAACADWGSSGREQGTEIRRPQPGQLNYGDSHRVRLLLSSHRARGVLLRPDAVCRAPCHPGMAPTPVSEQDSWASVGRVEGSLTLLSSEPLDESQ